MFVLLRTLSGGADISRPIGGAVVLTRVREKVVVDLTWLLAASGHATIHLFTTVDLFSPVIKSSANRVRIGLNSHHELVFLSEMLSSNSL